MPPSATKNHADDNDHYDHYDHYADRNDEHSRKKWKKIHLHNISSSNVTIEPKLTFFRNQEPSGSPFFCETFIKM